MKKMKRIISMTRLQGIFAFCCARSAHAANLKPGVYNIDAGAIKPPVSLCNTRAILIREDSKLDLCLTIHPSEKIDGKVSRAFNCERLPVHEIRSDMYRIDESTSSCMARLRAYANSAGISLSDPLQFSYDFGGDPETEFGTRAQVALQLNWLQQNKPFTLRTIANWAGNRMQIISCIILLSLI